MAIGTVSSVTGQGWQLIATNTTTSGTSSTFTGLSGYKTFLATWTAIGSATNTYFAATVNTSTSGYSGGAIMAGSNGYNNNTAYMALSGFAATTRNGYLYINNVLETAPKIFTGAGDTNSISETYNGAWHTTTAITSIEFKFTGGQAFTAGTIALYGIAA